MSQITLYYRRNSELHGTYITGRSCVVVQKSNRYVFARASFYTYEFTEYLKSFTSIQDNSISNLTI